jgi:hypothetical protein
MDWYEYIGKYDISPTGHIRNRETSLILKGTPNQKGYLNVTLYGKTVYIHTAVATAFIDNPDNLSQINHKDGIKSNNGVDNLEWITSSGNMQHAYDNNLINVSLRTGELNGFSKITTEDVIEIRRLEGLLSSRQVGMLFGLNKTHVLRIWRRDVWKHI